MALCRWRPLRRLSRHPLSTREPLPITTGTSSPRQRGRPRPPFIIRRSARPNTTPSIPNGGPEDRRRLRLDSVEGRRKPNRREMRDYNTPPCEPASVKGKRPVSLVTWSLLYAHYRSFPFRGTFLLFVSISMKRCPDIVPCPHLMGAQDPSPPSHRTYASEVREGRVGCQPPCREGVVRQWNACPVVSRGIDYRSSIAAVPDRAKSGGQSSPSQVHLLPVLDNVQIGSLFC